MDPIKHNADSRLGFTLHTITGFHRPSLTHYYGFICHLTLATFLDHSLNDTSNHLIGSNARLPQLLHWLPVRNSTLKHKTGLTEYRASRYFARLPSCLAESGSLALCTSNFLWLPSDPAVGQQRPCHSDYLPLSQGDSGFFQPDGFASFAGQTKKPPSFLTGACIPTTLYYQLIVAVVSSPPSSIALILSFRLGNSGLLKFIRL